ncbi:hypothetical protein FPOAC1_001063 [Fusarium poae]|uniref:hypothetical protein n=1 Tax=Fusarium poae TaxID=36050 RepID=UPI001CEAC121|nr:hypothetical protein FPOAC1_001063 [Fusarium poae]KAG8675086.1 hypothetical protein FPOAC1_001063 [Fusarium poae]
MMIPGLSTSSTPALDKLIASFHNSSTSKEQRDIFARMVSNESQKRNMATNAGPGAPVQNGMNGTSPAQPAHPYLSSQTPVPLPNYAAPRRQAPSASQSEPSSAMPPGQHRSSPVQSGTSYQIPSQPHAMQNGNAVSTPLRAHFSPEAQRNQPTKEFLNEYQALIALVDRAPATVVRQVIRDRWEKSLMGSQYHIAFLLNATMHQASSETIGKAVEDFGANLVQKAKHELVGHLSPSDIDELADSIIARAGPQFLDRILARRLETISARQLVNALARAERLGYNVQDIVREHDEQVIPSMDSVLTSSTMPPANETLRVQHYQPRVIPSQQLQQPQPPMTHPPAPAPPAKVSSPADLPMAALGYHKKKGACNKIRPTDQPGRDVCLLCGCRFGSNGGLLYHEKSEVCGEHDREIRQKMLDLIEYFRAHGRKAHYRAAHSLMTPRAQAKAPSTEHHATLATPSQPSSTPQRDPYAHLTPDQHREFSAIMRDAEEKYGGLMREAALLDEPERQKRLASLKNSYNTKQSTTRKKFGIRLRERRTRDEIEAEEARLFRSPRGRGTSTNGTPVLDRESHPKKRPRPDDMDAAPSASGTNSNQEHPQKRVSRAEMGGGLSGSQATAELTDPTAHLNPPQSRYTPQKSSAPRLSWPSNRAEAAVRGTQEDPMSIDEDDSDSDSDSDGDDDDIPATLD